MTLSPRLRSVGVVGGFTGSLFSSVALDRGIERLMWVVGLGI
jgi:hypothetical protein